MRLGKILLFLLLLVIGLLALAMSVCGGGVLLTIFRTGNPGSGWLLPTVVALGSLAIGVTILFVIWQAMKILAKKEL